MGILGDLQGPKIRTGKLTEGRVELVPGAEFSITTDESVPGTQQLVSTTYPFLASDVNPGDRILLDDGLLELRVLETDKKVLVRTEVVHGGTLKNNKGINLPGVALRAEALTPKDREDLVFGIKAGVDYVALSFVRQPRRPGPGARGDGRGGPAGADHRQAGEARGDRPAGRDPREDRRGDGGPR